VGLPFELLELTEPGPVTGTIVFPRTHAVSSLAGTAAVSGVRAAPRDH
jgi:hypothetical protein